MPHGFGHAVVGFRVEEQGLFAILGPQRLVYMAGGTRGVEVVFRHEGRGLALSIGDFLGGGLGEDVVVGSGQRVGISDVDLFLTGVCLALGALDRDARAVERVADRSHHALFLGGLEDVVVFVIGADRGQVAVAVIMRLGVAVLEQVEFQFRGHHCGHARICQPRDLRLQDRAWGHWDIGLASVIHRVAEHQSGTFLPRDAAQGAHVRLHHVVAVALRPTGGFIAGDRLHFDIYRQQVVA